MTTKYIYLFVITILFQYSRIFCQNIIFTGNILDSITKNPISNANIEIRNLNKKGLTGRDGKFSFDIKWIDTLIIVINAPDYAGYYNTVIIPKNTNMFDRDFFLQQGKVKLKEYNLKGIEILGNRFKEITPPSYTIKMENLSQLPIIAERDIFRSAQILPSVARENDYSSKLTIRGASHYQCLILFDDVPVYNTFHFGGLSGIFNTDIIGEANLYSSCYPPDYGGVTSSVFNVKSRDKYSGNMDIRGALGLITSSVAFTNRIGNGILTLAGRRTYLDFIAWASGSTLPYYNYDLYGKYKYILDTNNFLSGSILYTKDVFRDSHFDNDKNLIGEIIIPNWGNIVSSIRWEYYPSKDQSLNVLAFNTRSFFKSSLTRMPFDKWPSENININNIINEIGIKSKYRISKNTADFLFGFEYNYLNLDYYWKLKYYSLEISPEAFFDFAPHEFKYQDSKTNLAFFSQADIPISEGFKFLFGGRINYSSGQKKLLFNPHLCLKYIPLEMVNIYFRFGSYYQSLVVYDDHKLNEIYSDFKIPFFPDGVEIPTSNHYTISTKINEILPDLNINVEGYLITKDGIPFISYNDRSISRYSENTAGYDIFFNYNGEIFNGILSYTWGKSIRREGNSRFPGNYDQRHSLKAYSGFRIIKNLDISFEYFFNTGMPYSIPSNIFISAALDEEPSLDQKLGPDFYTGLLFGEIRFFRYRNNDRSPLYQRLDMTLTYNFTLWNFQMKSYLTFINLLDLENSYYYGVDYLNPKDKAKIDGIPLIPVIGVYFEK